MKKDLAIIFGLVLSIIVLITFGRNFTPLGPAGVGTPSSQTQKTQKEAAEVRIKTLNVKARVADSAEKRKKGLSEIDSLPLSEGMLFAFEKEEAYGIWMKDMKFAIDIIWMDKDKKIVDIAKNVAPEPGKKERELTIYKPQRASLYVLEVNAGLTQLHDLEEGDKVEFEL